MDSALLPPVKILCVLIVVPVKMRFPPLNVTAPTYAHKLEVDGATRIGGTLAVNGSAPSIEVTANNAGEWLSKTYGGSDRFGLGQYSSPAGGIMRVFTSGMSNATVRLSIATNSNRGDSGTFVDGVVVRSIAGLYPYVGVNTEPTYPFQVAGSSSMNQIIPTTDATYDLGLGSARWRNFYVLNSPVVGSDARIKKDVQNTALGLDFINKLRPVDYRMLDAGKREVTDENGAPLKDSSGNVVLEELVGARMHHGLIAQEVKGVLDELGVDSGMFVMADKTDSGSMQSLRYEELIGPLIRAVQQLSAEVAARRAHCS